MRRINDFDLKLLKLFITIADLGGFSAAQFKLNMHQSTISTRMNDLETRLGMTLCQRGRRGFRLTSDGERVYKLCQTLFVDIAHFEEQLDNIRNVSCGHIKLALIDNLATNPQCKIQQAIRQFCRKHPKVTIDTDIWDSYQIEMMLLESKIELGITSSEVPKDGLKYTYLFAEKQCLYCAPDHPILNTANEISIEELLQFPVVERGVSHDITPLSKVKGVTPQASSTNMEATAHMLLSGNFIGYLPEHYADIWVQRGDMVKISAPSLEYSADFHLTTLESKESSFSANELIQAIIESHKPTS